MESTEKPSELETKYQKLATEYSKVRSQATVLKKAVLDEQAKNFELKEKIREQEQKIRKHNQEMESLTFRNEQLTKRISVLQEDLQVNSHGKKSKSKPPENFVQVDTTILDEELQKKIFENAQLVSTMADKDLEIENNKEKIQWLEDKIDKLQRDLINAESLRKEEVEKLNKEKLVLSNKLKESRKHDLAQGSTSGNKDKKDSENLIRWKQEAERWKAECELLRARPESNEQLSRYYEDQISNILQSKQIALSEASSLWAENDALNCRLENLLLENNKLQNITEKCHEELRTTSENYRAQLDAMTEHLAAQNEKITKQCDEIQLLRHKLSVKK